MSEQEELRELFETLTSSIKHLEEQIVKVVVDSKTENDLVLRELTGYLNSVASEVNQLNNMMHQISNATQMFNAASVKLDDIENKTIEMPQRLSELQNKITETLKAVHVNNAKNYSAVYKYIQKLENDSLVNAQKIDKLQLDMSAIMNGLKSISVTVSKNQEVNNSIIRKLVEGNLDIAKTQITGQHKEKEESAKERIEVVKAEADIKKTKMNLQTKIILTLLGSGGIIYFIVESLIKLLSK